MRGHTKERRRMALILSAVFSATVLGGCVSMEELDRAVASQADTPSTVALAAQGADGSGTRDILGEWAANAPASDSAVTPSPSDVTTATPSDGEAVTDAATPTPAAESPTTDPNNPFGLPSATSSPDVSAATSDVESDALLPADDGLVSSEESSATAYPVEDAIPVHDGLYFNMSAKDLSELYSSATMTSGRDGMGQYLAADEVDDFGSESDPATAEFYFNDEDQLIAMFYHYSLYDGTSTFDASYVEEQMQELTTKFGPVDEFRYYDAWNQAVTDKTDVIETLQNGGRVIGCWYGDTMDVLLSLDNRTGSQGYIDICIQESDAPILNLPTPSVVESYDTLGLYTLYNENELAADYNESGKFIQVNGQIQKIARNTEGTPYVSFVSDIDGKTIFAYFPEKRVEDLLTLKSGDTVNVAGFLKGITHDEDGDRVELKQSIIVSDEDYKTNQENLSSPTTSNSATNNNGSRQAITPNTTDNGIKADSNKGITIENDLFGKQAATTDDTTEQSTLEESTTARPNPLKESAIKEEETTPKVESTEQESPQLKR